MWLGVVSYILKVPLVKIPHLLRFLLTFYDFHLVYLFFLITFLTLLNLLQSLERDTYLIKGDAFEKTAITFLLANFYQSELTYTHDQEHQFATLISINDNYRKILTPLG